MKSPLIIQYYSDLLCIWAWIAQRRIDELNKEFGEHIQFEYHYVDIFGNVPQKMQTSWSEKGGYNGFAQHVHHSAQKYEDAIVHPDVWATVKPTTSANAHLILKAVELTHDSKSAMDFALTLRKAFFINAQDISNMSVLMGLAEKARLNTKAIQYHINNGLALGELMSDYQGAKSQSIKGSPSYVIDGGRQTLYGNVGYRVLHANIEEMLKHPSHEASWC